MSEPSNDKTYGVLLFVGGIILITMYTAATFGNYFFPEIVHFEILGYNIFYYEFWILMTVWMMVMLLSALFVWLGIFILIKPLLDKSGDSREEVE